MRDRFTANPISQIAEHFAFFLFPFFLVWDFQTIHRPPWSFGGAPSPRGHWKYQKPGVVERLSQVDGVHKNLSFNYFIDSWPLLVNNKYTKLTGVNNSSLSLKISPRT